MNDDTEDNTTERPQGFETYDHWLQQHPRLLELPASLDGLDIGVPSITPMLNIYRPHHDMPMPLLRNDAPYLREPPIVTPLFLLVAWTVLGGGIGVIITLWLHVNTADGTAFLLDVALAVLFQVVGIARYARSRHRWYRRFTTEPPKSQQ